MSNYWDVWARQLRRYSDWLRAGRAGDRIPVEARFSAPVQTGPGAHPDSCTMGTGSFPGIKSGRGVRLTPYPFLLLRSRKSRAIPLLPLWAVRPVQSLRACKRVHFNCTFTSPIVSRVAQSLQRLLMGWTVWDRISVAGEIFCTCPDRPWGPPGLLYDRYRVFPGGKVRPRRAADHSTHSSAAVIEGQSYTSTPLRAVRPVQRLSACTRVLFTFALL